MNINVCTVNKNTEKKSSKYKFTEKRNPYKKYFYAKWKWTDIFLEIELFKDSDHKIFKTTSEKYNINYGTLKNKYNKYINNKNNFDVDSENRGKQNKTFSEIEEHEIFLFLKDNFIDKNKILCNDIIKIHANNKFKKLYPDDKFNASDGWCNMFKKRWNLSTVKITISKIATKTYTTDEINIFLNECKESLVKVGNNFFSI
jgi:hypothetical protein